jgi:hypothetical protein
MGHSALSMTNIDELPEMEISTEVGRVKKTNSMTYVPKELRDIGPIGFELLELGYSEADVKVFLEENLGYWHQIDMTYHFRCIWHKKNPHGRSRLKAKVSMRGFKPTMLNCFLYWVGNLRPVYVTHRDGNKSRMWKRFY